MKKLIKYFGIAVFCLVPLSLWAEDGRTILQTQCFSVDIKKQQCICDSEPKTEQQCYSCGGSWEDNYYDLVCKKTSSPDEDVDDEIDEPVADDEDVDDESDDSVSDDESESDDDG